MAIILALYLFFLSPPLPSPGETPDRIGKEEAPDSKKPSPIAVLKDIAVSQELEKLTVTFNTDRFLEPEAYMLENPPRLVLDFRNTINKVPFKKLPLNAPSARQLRVSQFQSRDPIIARVVFDLGMDFGTHKVTSGETSVQVTILPRNPDDGKAGPGTPGNSEGTAIKSAVTAESSVIAVLKDIAVSQERGKLTVTFKTDRFLEPETYKLENPPRLVLDFRNTINKVPFQKLSLNTPSAGQLHVSQFQSQDPIIARVVFDLGMEFGTHKVTSGETSVQLTILPRNPDDGKAGPGTP